MRGEAGKRAFSGELSDDNHVNLHGECTASHILQSEFTISCLCVRKLNRTHAKNKTGNTTRTNLLAQGRNLLFDLHKVQALYIPHYGCDKTFGSGHGHAQIDVVSVHDLIAFDQWATLSGPSSPPVSESVWYRYSGLSRTQKPDGVFVASSSQARMPNITLWSKQLFSFGKDTADTTIIQELRRA